MIKSIRCLMFLFVLGHMQHIFAPIELDLPPAKKVKHAEEHESDTETQSSDLESENESDIEAASDIESEGEEVLDIDIKDFVQDIGPSSQEFEHMQTDKNSTDLLLNIINTVANDKIKLQIFNNPKLDAYFEHKTKDFDPELLKTLELEINTYVEQLPEELKKLLPNWKQRFDDFKYKIALLKPFSGSGEKKIYPCGDKFIKSMGDFIATILGLKPFTITSVNEKQEQFLKMFLYSILKDEKGKIYSKDLKVVKFTNYFREEPYEEIALINFDPLIPFDFIFAAYNYDKKPIEVSKEFLEYIKDPVNNYRRLLDCAWIRSKEPKQMCNSNETEAVMLGLMPRVFNMLKTAPKSFWAIDPTQAFAFKSLNLPGRTSLYERTTYARLYELLHTYVHVALSSSYCMFISLMAKTSIHFLVAPSWYENFAPVERIKSILETASKQFKDTKKK